MWRKILMLALASMLCHATPITEKPTTLAPSAVTTPLNGDIQLIDPEVITLERFQTLLRRAGEIFRPIAVQMTDTTAAMSDHESLEETGTEVSSALSPYEYMLPPNGQPFNYYQVPFERSEHAKLDEKSRQLEHITPPAVPNQLSGENINYYAEKPKKLPKKFNAANKQLNMKWFNAFEKASANGGILDPLPKAVYLVNDERNRINFDDSFFAVDMQVKLPDNEPFKETRRGRKTVNTHGRSEEVEMEDLMAVAAAQVPQISRNYVQTKPNK